LSTALVTGGAGFIGQNLCKELSTAGWKVRVVDNFSSSKPRNLDGLDVDLVELDLRNEEIQHHKVFSGVDCVFHLAADVDNRRSWENPNSSISNNILSTLNVGLGAVKNGVRRILYSSTGTVYGDNPTPPLQRVRF
jgi:UDP-glucose 4-epimerase